MKNLKRVIAMVLVLCSVLSFVPSMVVAVEGEGSSTDPVTVTYDFELDKTDLTTNAGKSFAAEYLAGTAVAGAIVGYYDAGDLNWKYAANNVASFVDGTHTVSDMLYFGSGVYPWTGLRFGVKVAGAADEYPAGHWTALTVKVETAGTYDLTLNHQIRGDGSPTGEIYLLEGTYADNAAIEAAMTAGNLQATVDFSKTTGTIEDKTTPLGEAELKVGEYTVVFKAASKRSGAGGAYIYLRNLVAELKEASQEEPLTNVSYSFELGSTDLTYTNKSNAQKSFADGTLSETYVAAGIASHYDAGALNWKYAASNLGEGDSDFSYFGGSAYAWSGVRFAAKLAGAYAPGHWFALTLRSPGAGTYDISFDYQLRNDGNTAEKIYLIEGALTDSTAIAAAMTDANLLGTVNGKTAPDGTTTAYTKVTADLGEKTLGDGEYTVVFYASASAGNYFFANALNLAEKAVQETTTGASQDTTTGTSQETTTGSSQETTGATTESTTESTTAPGGNETVPVGYTFELAGTTLTNTNGGSFAAGILTEAKVKNAIDAYYDQDVISWKYALDNIDTYDTEKYDFGNTFYLGGGSYPWSGLRVGMIRRNNEDAAEKLYPAGYWIAITVKAPGQGKYKISLEHQLRRDGTPTGNVYVLPGTYTDIGAVEDSMVRANLRQVIDFRSSSFTMEAPVSADLGIMNLTADEYTFVFEATSVDNAAYMYLNELVFEATTAAEYVPQLPEEEIPSDEVPEGYTFELGTSSLTNEVGGSFAGGTLTEAKNLNALNAYYEEGMISWKYALDNIDSFDTDTKNASNTYYIGGGNYAWSGLRLGMLITEGDTKLYPAGYWTALTVKAPGSGKYQISLKHQLRADGTPAAEVYVLPGTYTDMAQIEALLTRDNLRQVFDCTSNTFTFADPVSVDLGIMNLTEGEYTIVFKATKVKNSAYMYLNELVFEATNKAEYKPELPKEEEIVPEEPEGYTFELGTSSLTNVVGGSFAQGTLTEAKNLNALNEYYEEGMISWKYALDNIDSFDSETEDAGNAFYIGGGNYGWDGLRLGMVITDKTDKTKKRYPAGYWMAITVKSPGTGNYKISLDYQLRRDGTPRGEIYVLPGTYTDAAAIEKQLTRDNLRQVIDFRGKDFTTVDADKPADLGIMNLKAGEYTIVFKAAKVDNAAYMYLNELTFKATTEKPYVPELPAEEKPVEEKPEGYNFALGSSTLVNINGGSFAGGILTQAINKEALEAYYDKGMISWKYAADNVASLAKKDQTSSLICYVGNTDTYKWSGTRFGALVNDGDKKTYPDGWWSAFTIKSPGKGTYYLHLDYQKRADAAETEIYLIKGKLTDPAAIEKQMTKSNLLSTIEMKSKTFNMMDASEYLGAVSMESGEYTLVIKAITGTEAGAYVYMNKLTFDTNPPPEPTEITYNFDLGNKEDGIYSGKALFNDKIDDLAQRYANGKLNWKYETKDDSFAGDANAFNAAYGMVMYASEENWMAFRIKSPGQGLYTMILNHAISARGALGAVYILPGDTTDIAAAMDHSNRVGKVQFYDDEGNVTVRNGSTTTMGTFEFEKNKEYILVFEAYDNTPYQRTVAYMWVSQLIAKKGDHTVSTVGQRKIQSMIVDPEPCKTMEPTIGLTTAEIDGQDYMFMPTEGRTLYIFNLEDNVLVRKVKMPFNICRGMTTDKDGVVWAVGDAQVLWRYDLRTNTSWKSVNYKLNGGIDGAGCGYAMTTDDEGNVYFGTNPSAYIVKYDPQANKFSKVGGEKLDPVDGDYANVPLIKDGYCYATVAGDKNADGKQTAYAVKIDLATNKIIARLDITEQYGEKEVMVRGGGICGETLFLGGISMEGFIAIDINTMQLKEYPNMHYQINYSPTEEIDGKCYFISSGVPYLYDSATDTIERIYGMDTATVGFRAVGLSSVTLSNNNLFPGISYVTMTGTGPKYYNFETKQVTTPALYDEDKEGSGQVVRTIIPGEEGDNNIYVGGYNTVNCAKINTETGTTTLFEATSSQTDALLWYEGVLYAGNYNAANLVRINFDDPDKNVILKSYKSLYGQARVHAIAAGDGMLFAGTIPDSFGFGGCLSITDLDTLQTHVEHDLIPTQCITSLAYNDGIVIGGTSIAGGTGAARQEGDDTSAVIFAYDVENKELLATLDLREIFPQLPDILNYIDGLVADPNVAENGRFWGMIGEALFYFTFDKQTKSFKVTEFLTFGYTNPTNVGRVWDDCSFAFDDEGYIYAAFHTTGGLQKINMNDPSDHQRINCETPQTFCLGNDGNLYYAIGTGEVKMYPLNVTEEDWQLAESVDALINAIGEVTLENEAAIVAARQAYDALDVGHRALVQLYDKLLEAETDLLELKIAALPEEITLEQEELIKSLLAIYEAMPAKEQKYVKNYSILDQANNVLQGLINEREAARVQKLIDETLAKLGEITLEDETEIKALREAYDALIFAQRELVDITGLLAAEAKIKELRQVRIDRLIALIAQIGEVTLEDEPLINEAMEIYEWMYMDERELVDYTTLLAAQKALQKLQKVAAAEVDALIEAIGGSVDYSSGDAIAAARAAYDALTPGSKAYVTLLHILEEAEALYAELFPLWAIIVIAVVVVAGGAAAVVVILKKRKAKKAVPTQEETPSEPQ